MIRFLLDANISPSTANFLSSLGYDAKSLLIENLGPISDEEVVHRFRFWRDLSFQRKRPDWYSCLETSFRVYKER